MLAVEKREDKTLTIETNIYHEIIDEEENKPDKMILKLTLDNLIYGDS